MCICLSKGDARTRKLRGSESMNRVCLRTVSRLYSPEPKQLREQQRGRKDRVSKAGLAALNKELYGHIYSCRKTLRRLLTFAHGRWLLMYPLLIYYLSFTHSFSFDSSFLLLLLPSALLFHSPPFLSVPLFRPLFFRSLTYSFSFVLFHSLRLTHIHIHICMNNYFSYSISLSFVL